MVGGWQYAIRPIMTDNDLYRSLGRIESKLDALRDHITENRAAIEKQDTRIKALEEAKLKVAAIISFISGGLVLLGDKIAKYLGIAS